MEKGLDQIFNPHPSTVFHLDINSCFARIEQQANPLLRGKPVAVAAYDSPRGCILAASTEAKLLGVKTGLRVEEGKLLCPRLIVLPPDPDKYRHVHLRLRTLLEEYSSRVVPKSIDEFVVNLENFPSQARGLVPVAQEIKSRIRSEIGDWISVSIGIGPNRFLAKVASNLKKPDGLEEINAQNYQDVYRRLKLTDLHGINTRLSLRLNSVGIFTPLDFYSAPLHQIRAAFKSVNAYYWYLRLRGWEIDDVDFGRKSMGHMFSLPRPTNDPQLLSPILHKLVEKLGFRLRSHGFKTQGVHLGLMYRSGGFWHRGVKLSSPVFSSADLYARFGRLLLSSPLDFPVSNISLTAFNLLPFNPLQLDLFGQVDKNSKLAKASDEVNEKYGPFFLAPAAMINTGHLVPDRIAFGGVKDLPF